MTPSDPGHTVRPIAGSDVAALHRLSGEAGWPHRPDDWRFVLGLGSGEAVCDAAGRIAGCAMWWPWGDEAATLGMVIVSRALRGRGLGRSLMARTLAAAGGRRIALVATGDGRPLYERLGFVGTGTVSQRQGIARAPSSDGPPGPGRVRPLAPDDRPAVAELDRAATGSDRRRLLDALAACATGTVHETGGRITGYAFTRAFGRGQVLGPLVAEADGAALALARHAVASRAGTFLRADTPLGDGPLARLLGEAGLSEVDVGLTMVRGGGAAASGTARVYCLASQALG